MKPQLTAVIQTAVTQLFAVDTPVELSRPEEKFGDYATNVALQLSKQLGRNPRAVAEQLADELRGALADTVADITIAGPGFINLRLSDGALNRELRLMLDADTPYGPSPIYQGQVIVAEYSDPNPFKVLHAGHLYTSVVGDAISNLYQAAGGQVHRVNFGGDVGMHVGKTMWAIVQHLGGEHPDGLQAIDEANRAEFLAACYVEGNNRYEDDETAKLEMQAINKKVYDFHARGDHESALAQMYWTCRQWSYDYFDAFYARIGTTFEKYYPESQTADIGLEAVREHVGTVFQESDGAIVFKGEEHGLHTRVFINSQGLPTYEAKDVGLILKKWQDYHFDSSLVITGNEQLQYMEVVLKAVGMFAPELAERSRHLTHGIVKLAGGVKMSSRKGNILRAVDVIDAAAVANRQATGTDDERVTLGAVKYAFLKQRTGGDIIYDPLESVSLQGNSGPYLQYAHARACSIARKAGTQSKHIYDAAFTEGERSLVRKMSQFPEVIELATREVMPHHICSYLYELAQTFNRFYENNRVIGDSRQPERLTLLAAYTGILRSGLGLLGIAAPDHM